MIPLAFRLCSLLLCSGLCAQNFTVELLETQPVSIADRYHVDQFGNFYRLLDDQVLKLNEQGKEVAAYSSPVLGAVSQLVVVNPLNPLLFYKDFNQLRVLDNRLNEVRRVDLLEAGFVDPTLVAQSEDNQIWIYDQVMDRVVRYRLSENRVVTQSLNLTQITGREGRPEAMFCSYNRVLLWIPEVGMLVFDAQGSYKKTLDTKGFLHFALFNDHLIMFGESSLLRLYDFKSENRYQAIYTGPKPQSLELQNDVIYLWAEGKRHRYRYRLP